MSGKIKPFFGPDIHNEPKSTRKNLQLQSSRPETIKAGESDCISCGLHTKCTHKKIPPYGKNKLGIAIIGEYPNVMADKENRPFFGYSYRILEEAAGILGIVPDRDFLQLNALNCYVDEEKRINLNRIKNCKPYVRTILEKEKPKVVVLLGATAIQSYFLEKAYKGALENKWQPATWLGFEIPDFENDCWVLCCPHPNDIKHAIERVPNPNLHGAKPEETPYWQPLLQTLENALFLRNKSLPKYPNKMYTTITEVHQLDMLIDELSYGDCPVVMDYETITTRPEDGLSNCLVVSMTKVDKNLTLPTYVLPLWEPNVWSEKTLRNEIIPIFSRLTNSDTVKIAHNISYEKRFTEVCLGIPFTLPYIDTMYREHLLQEHAPRALAFRAFARLGLIWKDRAGAFLEGKMDKMTFEDRNLYVADDTYGEALLYLKQEQIIDDNLRAAEIDGLMLMDTLPEIQNTGIRIDVPALNAKLVEATTNMQVEENKFWSMPEITLIEEETDKKFNPKSSLMMKNLLYDKLQCPIIKKTKTGEPSVDKQVIAEFSKKYPQLISLDTANQWSSYISNSILSIQKVMYDDERVRPSISTSHTKTNRSSSFDPNIQNQRARQEIGRNFRQVFLPEEGHIWCKPDFSQLEFRVAAILSGDQNAINAINNHYDIHGDFVYHLFCNPIQVEGYEWVPEQQPSKNDPIYKEWKKLRQRAKNEFVFAKIFGSFWKNIAVKMDLPEENVQNAAELFETTIMPDLAAWQRELWERFCRDGYIQGPFGHKARAPKSLPEVYNWPVQGTAFLGWTAPALIDLYHRGKREGWKSRILTTVHDEIDFSIHPDELYPVSGAIIQEMTRLRWDWASAVPIEVELAYGPNWYDLDGLFKGTYDDWKELTE